MKIAVILGTLSASIRPLDFWYENIWASSRGLTGTDLCFVKIAQELHKRGHELHLFTVHAQPHNKPSMWENMYIYNLEDRLSIVDDSFDCMISINEPDVFENMTSKPLRIIWHMLNDLSFAKPGFDNYVDCYLGVCEQHTGYLVPQTPDPNKWGTLSLGCDPEWYEDHRVPGRIVWSSSADRGLHWLLSQWPKIKSAVPYASLRIFYHFDYGNLLFLEPNDLSYHFHTVEMAHRLRYVVESIKRLKKLDVEHCKSISRNQMVKELNEASVFAYSCDTVAVTEGFSVSTLEAHASFTVPVMTDRDCLGGIYKDSGCIMINGPIKDKLPEFTSVVIKSLTDKKFANSVIKKCRKFAQTKTWAKSAEGMESIILNHPKYKERNK